MKLGNLVAWNWRAVNSLDPLALPNVPHRLNSREVQAVGDSVARALAQGLT